MLSFFFFLLSKRVKLPSPTAVAKSRATGFSVSSVDDNDSGFIPFHHIAGRTQVAAMAAGGDQCRALFFLALHKAVF